MGDDEIPVMPADPCDSLSLAITVVEEASRRAYHYGKFWMRANDKPHGRRWFAKCRELERIALRLRKIQFDALHPPRVDTPLREKNGPG